MSKRYKLNFVTFGSYVEIDIKGAVGSLDAFIAEMQTEDKATIEIEVVEMSDEEYNALPEFMGF